MCCPVCGEPSERVHAWHERSPADLPVAGVQVELRVRVRRSQASALASTLCGRRCDTTGARAGHRAVTHVTPAGHRMRTACFRVKVVSSPCPSGSPVTTSDGTATRDGQVPHANQALPEVLRYSPSWMAGPKPGHGVEALHGATVDQQGRGIMRKAPPATSKPDIPPTAHASRRSEPDELEARIRKFVDDRPRFSAGLVATINRALSAPPDRR
ncbi:transposase family protein [Promicromonospora sp. NPDC023987]|uniref:transposase family protein n=1 Tax=Promicromonospora sp. NPDC023987 TaxID=3155360 RepID=UPI0033C324D8